MWRLPCAHGLAVHAFWLDLMDWAMLTRAKSCRVLAGHDRSASVELDDACLGHVPGVSVRHANVGFVGHPLWWLSRAVLGRRCRSVVGGQGNGAQHLIGWLLAFTLLLREAGFHTAAAGCSM